MCTGAPSIMMDTVCRYPATASQRRGAVAHIQHQPGYSVAVMMTNIEHVRCQCTAQQLAVAT